MHYNISDKVSFQAGLTPAIRKELNHINTKETERIIEKQFNTDCNFQDNCTLALGTYYALNLLKEASEKYGIEGYDTFYGFVAGLLASNYDITDVFVDGIFRIGGRDYDAFGTLLEKLDKLTGDDVTVVFTVSADDSELPESVKQFLK